MRRVWLSFLILVLFCVFSMPVIAGTSTAKPSKKTLNYDMAECIRRGLSSNASISAAKELVHEADADVKSKRGAFFPKISASYSLKRLDNSGLNETDTNFVSQRTDAFTLSASQTVFSGGGIVNTYRRAKINKDVYDINLKQERIDLVEDIQTTFYNLLKARDDIRIVEKAIIRLKKQLESARAFYDVGMVTKQQVLQVEVDLALAEKSLVRAKNNVQKHHVKLCTLLNLPPLADVHFVGELEEMVAPLSFTLEECIRLALDRRLDLEEGQKQVELARKDAQIIFSRFFPTVSLNFSYVNQQIDYDDPDRDDTERDYWSLGLNASVTLFEGGRDYYEFRRYKHKEREKRLVLEDLRNQAASEVTTYYLAVGEALEQIRTGKKALDAASESFKAAEVNYSLQIGTITDVLNAQAKLTQAEGELNQAMADHQIAMAKLFHAIGTPIDIF